LNEEFESLIWKIISKKSVQFLDDVKTKTFSEIKTVQQGMDNFKNSYTDTERISFKTIHDEQLKTDSLKKQTPIFYESANTKLMKQMTNAYLTIQDGVFLSYNMITLFSKLSPIVFSRELSECESKTNVHTTNVQMCGKSGFQTYYDLIYSDLQVLSVLQLEEPLFWKIESNIQAAMALNNDELSSENDILSQLENECSNIQQKYTDAADLLVPQISSMGMKQQCLNIMVPQQQSSFIVPSTKDDFFSFIKTKYDSEKTDEFRRQVLNVFYNGTNDGILDPLSDEDLDDLLQDVELLSDVENSLFTCISLALNNGLINADSKTNNPYSENGMYSESMLRDAVADNITQSDLNLWSQIGPAFSHYSPSDPERQQYNFLFDENNNFIGNNEDLVKNAIRLGQLEGGKYNGDYETIQILENIFKVKIIVLHVEILESSKNYLPVGAYVRLLNKGNEVGGTIYYSTKSATYTYDIMLDDHRILRGIDRKDITYVNPIFFTVLCDDDKNMQDANDFTHYIVLLETGSKDEVKNYHLFYDSKEKQSIFTFEELPSFIYYSVFNSCAKPSLLSKKPVSGWYYENTKFNAKLNDLKRKFFATLTEKVRQKKLAAAAGQTLIGGASAYNVLSVPNKNLYNSVSNRGSYYGSYYSQDSPKLSYFIVIDLELYPGESIPLGEKAVLGCQNRYEKIRKAYAQLFGIKYFPTLFLRNAPTNKKTKTDKKSALLNNNGLTRYNGLTPYSGLTRYPGLYG
jgi:hypothetical protein